MQILTFSLQKRFLARAEYGENVLLSSFAERRNIILIDGKQLIFGSGCVPNRKESALR